MLDEKDLFADAGPGGFPTSKPLDFVDFGWADDDEDKNKKLTGRRKKLQRKVKPGSFGERRRHRRRRQAARAAACGSPRQGWAHPISLSLIHI